MQWKLNQDLTQFMQSLSWVKKDSASRGAPQPSTKFYVVRMLRHMLWMFDLALIKSFLLFTNFTILSQIFHIYQEIVRVIKGIVSSCFLDLQPSRIWSCIENKFFVYGDPKFTASLDRWNVIPACHCNTYSLKCTLWRTRNKRAKIISPSLLQVTL